MSPFHSVISSKLKKSFFKQKEFVDKLDHLEQQHKIESRNTNININKERKNLKKSNKLKDVDQVIQDYYGLNPHQFPQSDINNNIIISDDKNLEGSFNKFKRKVKLSNLNKNKESTSKSKKDRKKLFIKTSDSILVNTRSFKEFSFNYKFIVKRLKKLISKKIRLLKHIYRHHC